MPLFEGELFMDKVFYLLLLSGDDDVLTPFQGFSAGVCAVSRYLRLLSRLPASVIELTLTASELVESACAGLLKHSVMPLNVEHLDSLPRDAIGLFGVIFSRSDTDAQARAFADRCQYRPLHISTAENGADVTCNESVGSAVRGYICRRLEELSQNEAVATTAQRVLKRVLQPLPPKPLPFPRTSHNTVAPNEFVLERAGFDFPSEEHFVANDGDAQVIAAMRKASDHVLSLRHDNSPLATPSIILSTPGKSRAMEAQRLDAVAQDRHPLARKIGEAMKAMRRQTGYFHMAEGDEVDNPALVPLLGMRKSELDTFTDAVIARAVSEFSAYVRLPPAPQSLWQATRMLADCYRGNSAQRAQKLLRCRTRLDNELSKYFPTDLIESFERAPTGIRIVSDVPLEWKRLRSGEPLLFRHTCSRMPTSPGNIAFQQLLPKPTLHLPCSSLSDVLVLRSLHHDDRLRPALDGALQPLRELQGIHVNIVDIASREEFVTALNSFDGSWLVLDLHGSRTEHTSGLSVGDELIDPIELRGIARVPPIVFPLACDVHPVDGEHSSAGLALLSCGARTAIGTLLPVHGLKAALFAARLIRATHQLLPMMFKSGAHQISWAELFSIVQRSQLVHEIAVSLDLLEEKERIVDMIATGSTRAMRREHDWYAQYIRALADFSKVSEIEMLTRVQRELPIPDCSLYVQLGDPESVLIHPDNYADDLAQDVTRFLRTPE
jgi:hypothetical protein